MLPVVNNTVPRPQRQVLARFSVSALVATLPLLYVSLLRPPPAALASDTAFWFLMSNCVIAAILAADDAGTLFFGSSKPDHTPCFHDDNLSYVSGSSHEPAAAFQEATTMTSRNSIIVDDGALPFFVVHGEGDEVAVAPSRDMSVILLKGAQGQEEEMARRSDEAVPGAEEEVGIIKADGALLRGSEPEPYLLEEEVVEEEEEEISEAWTIAQRSRTPDLQQGNKDAGEGKLRRSVTEGSKPAAAEERDLWELSDEELNRRVEDFIARFNREMRRQVEQEAGV
ncbi:hypothetical protein QOZ80_3AG0224150 [Eleusine coracana subsp. coracana]|nr:hypothetical protein QOZ80_3AG0224150 [Eleusine coracana subsp. coracana]